MAIAGMQGSQQQDHPRTSLDGAPQISAWSDCEQLYWPKSVYKNYKGAHLFKWRGSDKKAISEKHDGVWRTK
jgi:hypothetical protein